MNRYLLILLFNCISVIVFAQNEENQSLYREINEQIFDTDNFYPKNILQTNKRFEHLNGKVKTEIIIYSDSTKIVNNYNINGKLTISKALKKEILRSTYNYEYKPDGITILKERGVNKLDYKVSYNDKYLTKYYVVQATKKKQGIFYKYLDTLFINETKYSYEFIKYINSKYSPIKVYKYKFKYNNLGYLKHIQIFENEIKVGHFINKYNKNNQVINQDLFWEYKWFVEDTGFPSIRNQIRKIEYKNGLIKTIINKSYNPTSRKWETSTKHYNCKLKKKKYFSIVNCNCNNEEYIRIKVDHNENWIFKSVKTENKEVVTKRELEYYK